MRRHSRFFRSCNDRTVLSDASGSEERVGAGRRVVEEVVGWRAGVGWGASVGVFFFFFLDKRFGAADVDATTGAPTSPFNAAWAFAGGISGVGQLGGGATLGS